MIDKPIKDLTPEEREQVIQEIKETATPEEWESITKLAGWIGDAQAWLRQAAYYMGLEKSTPETAAFFIDSLREFLPLLIDELEKDPEAAKMTPHEFLESGKYGELVDRAANRAANSLVDAQQIGRDKRRQLKQKAQEQNAIMELRSGGNMPIFSQRDLWDAFAPGRIYQEQSYV